jgi:hypothetical protein
VLRRPIETTRVIVMWLLADSQSPVIPFERSRPAADATREVNGAVVA